MARRLGLSLLVLFLGILLSQDPASAARKKKKRKKAPAAPPQEIVVTEDDIFRVEVSVRPPANKKKKNKNKAKKGKKGKKGKKKKKAPAAAQYSVACLDRIPGEVVNQEDGSMRFVSYSEKIRSMKGNKKQARKNRNAIQLLNKILAAARDKCIRPPFSSFDRYDGEFGTEQAATLLYRATMGPRPGEIQQAVNDGLEAAVNRLFVTADEPVKQFIKEDLWCDGRLPWDEDNEECDASDPDDIYLSLIHI